MKKNIVLCNVILALLFVSCSKEGSSTATIGGNRYSLSSAYAYQWNGYNAFGKFFSNTELCIGTSGCYLEDGEIYGDYFYIDLYWEEEVQGRLVEGTYTLGDEVLDEVCFTFDDSATQDIDAETGTLTISGKGDKYTISFSGSDTDGSKIEFKYLGNVTFLEW